MTWHVTPLAGALAWLERHCPRLPPETINPEIAAGRILAQDLTLTPAPTRPTAAIDGLAVRAADTEGATDYTPRPIRGTPITAGSPLPEDADAILPPHTHDLSPLPAREGPGVGSRPNHTDPTTTHTVTTSIPRGHGVIPAGHDIPPGTTLPAGTRLTPLHLAMLPNSPIAARRQPTIGGTLTPTLQALAREAGAHTQGEPDLLLNAPQDFQPEITALALRPGETTQLGHIGKKPAIRLPHHPADAATVFALLVAPTLRRLAGRPDPAPIPARLTRKVASGLGQADAIRVRLHDGEATPLGPAEHCPLAAAITANGLVLVPEASEGYPAGTMVPVIPL